MDDGKKPKSHEMRIWGWGIAAVVYVGLRILVVSRGDTDTARALSQNLNVTAIILPSVLPFMTIVALFLLGTSFIGVLHSFRRDIPVPKSGKKQGPATYLFLVILFGVLVYALRPALSTETLLWAGIIVGLTAVLYLGSWKGKQKMQAFCAFFGAILILVVFLVGMWRFVTDDSVWLPRERLAMGWGSTGVVYVLSADENWIKYLDDASRKVHVVPTDRVRNREAATGTSAEDDATDRRGSAGQSAGTRWSGGQASKWGG